jgi:hypothetical protein
MRRILERSGALDEQYIIAIGRLTRHLREIAEDCNAIFEATWTAFDCR